jgi:hypothetical protein
MTAEMIANGLRDCGDGEDDADRAERMVTRCIGIEPADSVDTVAIDGTLGSNAATVECGDATGSMPNT